jgi:hypothetical protein
MVKCGYCGNESSDEYNFCEHCHKQIRCTAGDCGALLKPGAPICLKCGRQTGPLTIPGNTMNEYVEERKPTGELYRSIRATDAAAGVLLQIMADRVPMRSVLSLPPSSSTEDQDGVTDVMEKCVDSEVAESIDTGCLQVASPEVKKPGGLRKRVERYFYKQHDGKFVSRMKDFKGKTKKEQQVRVALLCGLAYRELAGGPVPEREHFNVMAENASLRDNAFRTQLAEALHSYFNIDDGAYVLTTDGEDRAVEALREMEDSSLQGWTRKPGRTNGGGNRGPLSSEDAAKIAAWAADDVDAGKVEIRDLDKPRTCAMFALWVVTKHLRKVEAVEPKIAYAFMKRKYETISVSAKAFKDTLCAKGADIHFKSTGNGRYFLTPAAEKIVEAWRSTGRVEISKQG